MIDKQKLIATIGNIVYGSVLRQRGKKILEELNKAGTKQTKQVIAKDIIIEEVSEEITVWGSDEGGGGTDTITLDIWMWEFKIDVIIPPIINPVPPAGGDTPESEPCKSLRMGLDFWNSNLEAEKTALKALDELIAKATTSAERKALRTQKNIVLKNISQAQKQIKEIKAKMKDANC